MDGRGGAVVAGLGAKGAVLGTAAALGVDDGAELDAPAMQAVPHLTRKRAQARGLLARGAAERGRGLGPRRLPREGDVVDRNNFV